MCTIQCMDHKSWVMGHGSWVMGHGSWVMGHGSWVMGHGSWVMGQGSWVMGQGTWVMGHGSYTNRSHRSWVDYVESNMVNSACTCSVKLLFTLSNAMYPSKLLEVLISQHSCIGLAAIYSRLIASQARF